MSKKQKIILFDQTEYPIFVLNDRLPFMLVRHVAEIYGTDSKNLNRQIKRNGSRFPPDFYFELTPEETRALTEVPNCHLDWNGGHPLKALTKEGCNAASFFVKTEQAIQRSIEIIRKITRIEEKLQLNNCKKELVSARMPAKEYIQKIEQTAMFIKNFKHISNFYNVPKNTMVEEATKLISENIGLNFNDSLLLNSNYRIDAPEQEVCISISECIDRYKNEHGGKEITIKQANEILYMLGYQISENEEWAITDKGKPFIYKSSKTGDIYWKYSKIKKAFDHFFKELDLKIN